jgi:predicted alpha-1,2-mannosidase
MRPRLANGKWKKPFNPFYAGSKNDYVEGNAWQYSWYVPQDVPALIGMMGGRSAFAAKLDSLFSINAPDSTAAVSDVSGLIGQYAHGNEPSHHIPYLYNYCGEPSKTRQIVRKIMNTMYSDQPDGLSGNEDCGQMSAWYVFSALGFYPVNPASGNYDLGIPEFPKTELHLEGNKVFTILANKLNDQNIYVKSIKLNGHPYNKLIIPHDSIMAGGTLVFEMAAQPGSD